MPVYLMKGHIWGNTVLDTVINTVLNAVLNAVLNTVVNEILNTVLKAVYGPSTQLANACWLHSLSCFIYVMTWD